MGLGLWARAYGLVPALQATGMRRRDVSNAAEPNGTSSLEKKTENYAGQRELKKTGYRKNGSGVKLLEDNPSFILSKH